MSTTVGLPQFSHIKIEHFKSHLDALLKNHLEEIDRLLKENHHYTWDNLIYPLDSLADELERFWSPFAHMHAVMDSETIRESYEACLPLLSAYDAAIGHNQDLYEAIKSIDQHSLNPAQKKSLQTAYRISSYRELLYPRRIKSALKPFNRDWPNYPANSKTMCWTQLMPTLFISPKQNVWRDYLSMH